MASPAGKKCVPTLVAFCCYRSHRMAASLMVHPQEGLNSRNQFCW